MEMSTTVLWDKSCQGDQGHSMLLQWASMARSRWAREVRLEPLLPYHRSDVGTDQTWMPRGTNFRQFPGGQPWTGNVSDGMGTTGATGDGYHKAKTHEFKGINSSALEPSSFSSLSPGICIFCLTNSLVPSLFKSQLSTVTYKLPPIS